MSNSSDKVKDSIFTFEKLVKYENKYLAVSLVSFLFVNKVRFSCNKANF